MASEIFGTAAIFWVLIPVGLAGGALLLKLAERLKPRIAPAPDAPLGSARFLCWGP
jgi:cytochrome b6-f complex subunit 7